MQTKRKAKPYCVDPPRYEDGPATLRLCIPNESGKSTGLLVAKIAAERRYIGADYFEVPDYPMARLLAASPVLLSACRDALALLTNPDAEAFDADAVTATLERAIANAERGEG
jgi:hypothetical protein